MIDMMSTHCISLFYSALLYYSLSYAKLSNALSDCATLAALRIKIWHILIGLYINYFNLPKILTPGMQHYNFDFTQARTWDLSHPKRTRYHSTNLAYRTP